MSIRRTKEQKQRAAQKRVEHSEHLTYQFYKPSVMATATKNVFEKNSVAASKMEESRSVVLGAFPYEVGLLYQDLQKTVGFAALITGLLLVVWKSGVVK